MTGNKALLAEHGGEIFREAGKRGLAVGFEASVGGGVPIIRTLREALAGDRQRAVYGIVNGTCNSILTTMTENGVEFGTALADAQAKGLAEANPATDVEGHDSAHKLCLLVTLAFGVLVKPAQVYTEGITRITQADIAYARELGYVIKLLAIGKDDDGKIEARVHPTMIPQRHLLAGVGGAFNAIYIHGDALGATMYSGLGAGEMPSATAVMADILRNRAASDGRGLGAHRTRLDFRFSLMKGASVKPMDDVVCEYYLRFTARDKPGVLGAIASVLGQAWAVDRVGDPEGSRKGARGAGDNADARGARAQPETRAGGDSQEENRASGTRVYPNRGEALGDGVRLEERIEKSAAVSLARAHRALPALPAGDGFDAGSHAQRGQHAADRERRRSRSGSG